MAQPRFRVLLMGDLDAVRRLSPRLQSPRLAIEEEASGVYLVSSEFEDLATRDEVSALARQIIVTVRGAMRLAGIVEHAPLELDAVVERGPDGSESKTLYRSAQAAAVIAEAFPPTILISGTPVPPPPLKAEAAFDNDHVAIALALLAEEPTWYDLYKVLELIEQDYGGEKAFYALNWEPEAELRRFTHTANNVGALGLDARHARLDWTVPADPMSLAEATELIRRLLERWLASK
jgi:hypothetical protein